jgi:hypothetical protein
MDTQYTAPMTTRAGIWKTPVAGPKKKVPAAEAAGTTTPPKE